MSEESRFPRLRAAIRNSVAWGVVWGGIGTAVASAMRLANNIPFGRALVDGLGMGIRIGFMGGIVGAAFFAFIGIAYRGKRLSEISWKRFGIGGAVLAGLFVPAFLQTMNLLTGGELVPWNLVFDDVVFSALFGLIKFFHFRQKRISVLWIDCCWSFCHGSGGLKFSIAYRFGMRNL